MRHLRVYRASEGMQPPPLLCTVAKNILLQQMENGSVNRWLFF
jgi:hypothetical protein